MRYENDAAVDPATIPAAWTDADLPYLALPNRVELVLTDVEAPAALTRTAFLLPLLEDGSVVMAVNRRRGAEFPGGHIDPGEDARTAARREGVEETGCEVGELVPVGFLRMVSEGTVPDGWPYPHPIGYQQFYAARVTSMRAYVENDECLSPSVVGPTEAAAFPSASRRIRYEHAVETLAAWEAAATSSPGP